MRTFRRVLLASMMVCAIVATTGSRVHARFAGSIARATSRTRGQRYSYTWKTVKNWAGTCRQLTVQLKDGSVHTALFHFK